MQATYAKCKNIHPNMCYGTIHVALLYFVVLWTLLVTIVWCVLVVHLLFYSLSRTHQVATLVRSTEDLMVLILLLYFQGRQFYKCSTRDGGCDFFLWADSPPTTSAPMSSTVTAPPSLGDSSHYRLVMVISVT